MLWGQRVVAILRRSPTDIARLSAAPVTGRLPKISDNSDLAPEKRNAFRSLKKEILVFEPACGFDGCLIVRDDDIRDEDSKYRIGQIHCPCCGSGYDTAGRVLVGPSPRNLVIPPYHFIDGDTLVVGEDPAWFQNG